MPKTGGASQMSDIRQIIRAEIANSGAISFARFMGLALYCPKIGYYERPDMAPGQSGDFYTSVSVGDFFGELLAIQFAEWLETLPVSRRQIVEAGAHDGRLALDILRSLRANQPELLGTLEYWIIEPSAQRRESQVATLAEFAAQVRWFESWNDVPPPGVNGVIFANELLDAMPVQRLGWDAAKRKWFEWGVTLAGDEFAWTRMSHDVDTQFLYSALRTPHSALEPLLAILPDGFTTEICPAAVSWWRQAARALQSGKLLTFDYGLSAEQFFTPERKDGTLRAYYRHQQSSDVLARVGEQDLTAQVNFSAVTAAGEAEGLQTEAWTGQGRFLTALVERAVAQKKLAEQWTPARIRQFQTLTHPQHLGRAFQVVVHGR